MNPAYISALAGLIGAAIGGLTSFANSWLTQRTQLRDTHREAGKTRREALYVEFIDEAAHLLGDAYSHQTDDAQLLVKLFALTARMRLVSPRPVVVAAEKVLDAIGAAYLGPNYTLREVFALSQKGEYHFFEAFSEACRQDLNA
jgi:hypothetical protein